MKIKKGSSRIAFVGEEFTIKVPNPSTLKAIKYPLEKLSKGESHLFRRWFEYTEGNGTGLRRVFSGVLQNRREAQLSSELEDIVVPTRISIFGLLNIQNTAPTPSASLEEIGIKMIIASNGDAMRDLHTFCQSENYGVHNGEIKLRDYGSPRLAPILRKHSNAIREALAELE